MSSSGGGDANSTDLDATRRRLALLRSRDTSFAIYGSSEHRYVSTPLGAGELEAFEAVVGVRLPSDYRTWLQEVGVGAGPYNGLWTLAEIHSQRRTDVGRGGDVDDPVSIGHSEIKVFEERSRRHSLANAVITANGFTGAIPIGSQGCSGVSYLMLAGAFRGCVFGECGDCIGEPWTAVAAFWPEHHRTTSVPPPFLVWVDNWLEDALRQSADYTANPSAASASGMALRSCE